MRIGINARCLSCRQTGIGRYVNQLCKVMMEKEHEIICYLPGNMHKSFDYIDGVNYREGGKCGLFQRVYWENVILPSKVAQDEIDVFWEPAHRLARPLVNKVPTVLTIHDLVWIKAPKTMRLKSWLAERLFTSYSINSADIVVTASEATKRDLENHFARAKSTVSVVTPGVTKLPNISSIENFKKHNFQQPFFLSVGTVEPRKNHARLLQAYSKLSEELREKAHLVIVGGKGWGDINLSAEIQKLGLKNYVHYLEYVDDKTLASLYQKCMFLAMPSLYEGFGMPLAEAMSYGKPVLTSNISSMPEVSQKAGVLVSPDDINEIKQALESLISSEKIRDRLSVHAIENANKFCWIKSSESLIEAFSMAINKTGTAK